MLVDGFVNLLKSIGVRPQFCASSSNEVLTPVVRIADDDGRPVRDAGVQRAEKP
jgi:hypothetical protein